MLLPNRRMLQWKKKQLRKRLKPRSKKKLKIRIRKKTVKPLPAMKVKKKLKQAMKLLSVILHPTMVLKFLKRFLVKLLSKRNQNLKLQLPQLPQLLPVLPLALNHQKKTNTLRMNLKKQRSLKPKVMISLNKTNLKKPSNNIQKLFSVMFLQAKKLYITVTELW
jgi:hypothetical protein